jgi:hypothetical protein
VLTVNVAVVDPTGIVTSTGTKATVPVVHSSTPIPPAGAAALMVTVPVVGVSDLTLAGLTETETRATAPDGLMVSVAVLLTPL